MNKEEIMACCCISKDIFNRYFSSEIIENETDFNDDYIRENIEDRNHENVINYLSLGETAKLAVPTPDHFNPILYILGAYDKEDKISTYNNSCMMGSLSMTSYLFS